MSLGGDELSARGNPERYRRMVDGQPFRLPHGPGGIQRPQIDRELQDQIAASLRGLYGGLLEEPVPDHLIDFIRRLK